MWSNYQEDIELHRKWLEEEDGGARLDWSCCDLSGANLCGADLSGANLSGAKLFGANLSNAGLSGAKLFGAKLFGANLSNAGLSGANLSGANLCGADLRGADLREADLANACLGRADLTGSLFDWDAVPEIPDIDKRILKAIQTPGNGLDMTSWHQCATTHCRAGWAVVLSGTEGLLLEEEYGTNAAAALIYAKSRPGTPVPDWDAPTKRALEDLHKWTQAANT